jgi:hypothetical protein
MKIFLLVAVLLAVVTIVWKWATKSIATISILPAEPAALPIPTVQPLPVGEMAVTDGEVIEVPVKKMRKPRKKTAARAVTKKVVKRTRKPKAQ